MQKIKLEGELGMRMTSLKQPQNQQEMQQMQQMILIERTKVLDIIYIKYGVKFQYLNYAYEFYQLDDDQDIRAFEISLKVE